MKKIVAVLLGLSSTIAFAETDCGVAISGSNPSKKYVREILQPALESRGFTLDVASTAKYGIEIEQVWQVAARDVFGRVDSGSTFKGYFVHLYSNGEELNNAEASPSQDPLTIGLGLLPPRCP
jgi:hypothetical protein